MQTNRPVILLGSLILACADGSGQSYLPVSIDTVAGFRMAHEDRIEKMAENLDGDQDFSNIEEEMNDHDGKPVNLNTLKKEELNEIPLLTASQRASLKEYLETYGEVLSMYELQSIRGFDSLVIRSILPFISITPQRKTPALSPGNLIRFGHYDLLLRYEQAFPKSLAFLGNDSLRAADPGLYYPGTPQKYYFRYRFSWFDKVRIGIAGEKDPGEQFFRGVQSNGMDFYAAYLSLSDFGILKNLTIGNFRVSYGQGLTIGSGLSSGGVPGFSSYAATATGIRPSMGMNEDSYLRGLAATIKINRAEFSGFVSYHPRDATISRIDSVSPQTGTVSSFSSTGYHRTRSELEKMNAVTELVCGGNVNLSMAPGQQFGFRVGVTGIYCRYSANVSQKFYPYNRFVFRGKELLNTGFDFQIRFHGIYLFGEVSKCIGRGMSWVAGARLNPDPLVGISLICRNYQPDYQNLFSNAFAQNTLNANERGIYTAINAVVNPKINLSGYIDLFMFPWMKYRADRPTLGHEWGLMLGWKASANVLVTFRFCQKNTQLNGSAEPNPITHKLCDNRTCSYRAGIELHPGNGIVLNTRIEAKQAGETTTELRYGYLAFQEIQIRSVKWPESFILRFALFDIPDYSARIYVYEPEVLFGYAVPSFQGKGIRTCLVTKFRLARWADLWVRGGITYYTDRYEVGTGPDRTDGNARGELTCQLLVRL